MLKHADRQLQAVSSAAFLLLLVIWLSSASYKVPRPVVNIQEQSAAVASVDSKGRPRAALQVLEDTLQRLENEPILSYDAALKRDNRTCLDRQYQSNPDQLAGESEGWMRLSKETIRKKRAALFQAVREKYGLPGLSTATPHDFLSSPMFGSGRGLVFTGGNKDTLKRIANSLRILRKRHGCQLPVEIFAFAEELAAVRGSPVMQELEQLGAVTFHQFTSKKVLGVWKNFQIKAEAMIRSSFSEILYLDSDNILLTDPTFLFDHFVYKQHGAVFWPDITKDGPSNPFWRIANMECRRHDWQMESGQILFNKKGSFGLNLSGLVVALEMQRDHEFWFKISGGDKDTFRYGFYFLGLPYSTSPHWLSSLGPTHNYAKDGHTFCGLAMLQYSLAPEDWRHFPYARPTSEERQQHAPPLFVHANLLKHSAGYTQGHVWTTLKRMQDDLVSKTTDRYRSTVYTSMNGMCVDVWDAFDAADPRPGGTFENGEVIVEDAKQAFGGVLSEFEDMFWAEGGVGGGF